MIQSVLLNRLVVKPGAVASLPLDSADHAEFRFASASHMVTTFFQFDSRAAVIASLPSFFLGDFDELLGGIVFGTCPASMPAAIAGRAYFGLASPALTVLPPRVRSSGSVNMDTRGFDPFAAAAGWTVKPVLCCIFLILLIPFHLELEIEQLVYVLERNVFGGAAFWGHMLGVGNGEGKDTAQAGMAHAVVASQTSSSRGWIRGHTCQAFNAGRYRK